MAIRADGRLTVAPHERLPVNALHELGFDALMAFPARAGHVEFEDRRFGITRRQDLVHAVDLIITKPGYGIVSECIANGTPLVYTSRGVFPEYDVFVREMPRYLRCAYLSNEDLLGGRWGDAIEAAVNAPPPPDRPRTDGAEVVADMMAACLPGASSSPPPASP